MPKHTERQIKWIWFFDAFSLSCLSLQFASNSDSTTPFVDPARDNWRKASVQLGTESWISIFLDLRWNSNIPAEMSPSIIFDRNLVLVDGGWQKVPCWLRGTFCNFVIKVLILHKFKNWHGKPMTVTDKMKAQATASHHKTKRLQEKFAKSTNLVHLVK